MENIKELIVGYSEGNFKEELEELKNQFLSVSSNQQYSIFIYAVSYSNTQINQIFSLLFNEQKPNMIKFVLRYATLSLK